MMMIMMSIKLFDQSNFLQCQLVTFRVIDNAMQNVKYDKSVLLVRSHCSSGNIITDAMTSPAATAEMRSIETISGKQLMSQFSLPLIQLRIIMLIT